jgi:hypothetical protein
MKSSMKLQRYLLNIILLVPLSLQSLSPNDLTSAYSTASNNIDNFQQALNKATVPDAQVLQQAINDTRTQIQQSYNTTQQEAAGLINDSSARAKLRLDAVLSTGIAAINDAYSTLATRLNAVSALVQEMKEAEAAKEAARQQAEINAKRFAQIMSFWQDVRPAVGQFTTITATIETLFKRTQPTKPILISNDTIISTSNDLTKVIDSFNSLYIKYSLPVLVNDPANFVAASYRTIISFFLRVIDEWLLHYKGSTNPSDQISALNSITLYFLGNAAAGKSPLTLGFDGIVTQLAQKYFPNSSGTALSYYYQQKIDRTFIVLLNALQMIAGRATPPSLADIAVAKQLYDVIAHDATLFPKDKAAGVLQEISTALATVYVAGAQNQIKQIKQDSTSKTPFAQAVQLYQQAAQMYAKANDAANAQLYQQLHDNLQAADQAATQGQAKETANALPDAITLYQQAEKLYRMGGDPVDANRIAVRALALSSQQTVQNLQAFKKSFNAQTGDAFAKALQSLSTVPPSFNPIDSFKGIITQLLQVQQNALAASGDLAAMLQASIQNNTVQAPADKNVMLLKDMKALVAFLSVANKGIEALIDALQVAQAGTVSALEVAEQSYNQALYYLHQADQVYIANGAIAQYLPLAIDSLKVPAITSWYAFGLFIKAAQLSALAQNSNDQILATRFYTASLTDPTLLPATFNQRIQTAITTLNGDSKQATALLAAAQQMMNEAAAATDDQWKADAIYTEFYQSPAFQVWQNALKLSYVAATLKVPGADQAYIQGLQNFAAQYLKLVPVEWLPKIGAALIYYQLYLFQLTQNQTTAVQQTVSLINQLVGPFYQRGVTLLAQLQNQSGSADSKAQALQGLLKWQQAAQNVFAHQQQMLSGVAGKRMLMLTITYDVASDTTTYAFDPAIGTVVLPNLQRYQADLSKEQGLAALKAKDYTTAYALLSKAQEVYQSLGLSSAISSFQDELAKSQTLSIAQNYYTLVQKGSTKQIIGLAVPSTYELKLYTQRIPQVVAQGFGDLTKITDKSQISQLTINIATALYLYNKLQDLFGATAYQDLVINKGYQNLGDAQKSTYVAVVKNSTELQQLYTQRVATKQTSFSLVGIGVTGNVPQFELNSIQIPLPRFPSTFYPTSFPSAIEYYTFASRLFAAGDPSDRITVGDKTLVPGNDPVSAAAVTQDMIILYIAHAEAYLSLNEQIKGSIEWKKLISLSATDRAKADIASFMPLFSQLDHNYQMALVYYNGPYAQRLIDTNNSLYPQIQQRSVQIYKDAMVTMQMLLVGDPLTLDYLRVLKQIETYAISAVLNYQGDQSLYGQVAQLYDAAGEIVVANGNYFGALPFFTSAENLYRAMPDQAASVKSLAENELIKKINYAFTGATNNMGLYEQARLHGVSINDPSKGTYTMPLADLVTLYNSWVTQAGTGAVSISADQIKQVHALQGTLLDALIFYQAIGKKLSDFAASLSTDSSIDAAAKKLVDDFTARNQIAFDTVDTIIKLMQGAKFPDGTDFVQMLLKGFTQFKNQALQSSDPKSKAIAYAAMASLANKLFLGFGFVFMQDFYGGVSAQGTINLSSAINVEIEQIKSPTEQYFEPPTN